MPWHSTSPHSHEFLMGYPHGLLLLCSPFLLHLQAVDQSMVFRLKEQFSLSRARKCPIPYQAFCPRALAGWGKLFIPTAWWDGGWGLFPPGRRRIEVKQWQAWGKVAKPCSSLSFTGIGKKYYPLPPATTQHVLFKIMEIWGFECNDTTSKWR